MSCNCNSIRASAIKVDKRSDFIVELNISNCDDTIDAANSNFKIIYKDRRGRNDYEIIHLLATGTEDEYFKNCFISDGKMFAKFENYNFSCGVLSRDVYIQQEVSVEKGDNFEYGKMNLVQSCLSDIEIIDNPEDCVNGCLGVENITFISNKGDAATISIGEVETVDYDIPADVENVGTENDAILNFKIPKGYTPDMLIDFFKQGINGDIFPHKYSFPIKVVVKGFVLFDCADFSVTIEGATYDKSNFEGVEINPNEVLIFNDLDIIAGSNEGSVQFILKIIP